MQSLLFVFIGLPGNNSDASLQGLLEKLNKRFEKNEIVVFFTRKDELLSARLDGVSFYISFLKSKGELKDWYQMAIDFELKLNKKPIDKDELVKRYIRLKSSSSNLYKEIHYATSLVIIEEMEKFSDLTIFSFQ